MDGTYTFGGGASNNCCRYYFVRNPGAYTLEVRLSPLCGPFTSVYFCISGNDGEYEGTRTIPASTPGSFGPWDVWDSGNGAYGDGTVAITF